MKTIILAIMAGLMLFTGCTRVSAMESLQNADFVVLYEPGADQGAERTARIYPVIKTKTEKLFGRTYSRKAVIVLISQRERFVQMADHAITVAYAVPSKNLIVIDYSMVASRPFSLETTLTHEFCHLLLHKHVPGIPRWLDEGICQWVSGGIDEIIYNRRQSALSQASVTGEFIPFERLVSGFPLSETGRILAYEQSQSFVTYLVRQFGQEKLFDFLDRLSREETVERAFSDVYNAEFGRMEITWQNSIRKDYGWFIFISNHMYEILFVTGALLTVIAFLKIVRKKERYEDEDEE